MMRVADPGASPPLSVDRGTALRPCDKNRLKGNEGKGTQKEMNYLTKLNKNASITKNFLNTQSVKKNRKIQKQK